MKTNKILLEYAKLNWDKTRNGSSAAATSKIGRFVIIINGLQPLTIITMGSVLDVAAALDQPLKRFF